MTTAPVVQANYEQLADVARKFKAQADLCGLLEQQLGQRMAALQHGDWMGKGAAAFFAEMKTEVFPAMRRLTAALEQAGTTTLDICHIMQTAEEEAAAPFKNGRQAGPQPKQVATGMQAHHRPTGSTAPPPRIYIINGINSAGNVFSRDQNGNPIIGDDQSEALEKIIEKHGYDPDQVKATRAIFTKPQPTNLSGTALSGTRLGGMLSPVDWLTGQAATGLNAATSAGARAINQFTRSSAYSSAIGGAEVLGEYVAGKHGPNTQKVYNEIVADLKKNPLAPGQTILLMGHSGGGAVAANLAGMIERNLGHNVSGMVTMGSPVSNYDEAGRYAELIVDVRHAQDNIAAPLPGIPIIRSAESRLGVPLGLATALVHPGSGLVGMVETEALGRASGDRPNVQTVTLRTPVTGGLAAHGSYMDPNNEHTSVSMLRQLNALYPNLNLQLPAAAR